MILDHGYDHFLREQVRELAAFTAGPCRVHVLPEPDRAPPREWLATFDCRTLVRRPGASVEIAAGCAVAIRFPHDYLARVDTFEILRWLAPAHPFHPNVHPLAPVLCVGLLYPAMSLVELLYQIHQVATWRNVTLVESNALNPDACAWARSHAGQYPVDDRPLRGGPSRFRAEVRETGGPR